MGSSLLKYISGDSEAGRQHLRNSDGLGTVIHQLHHVAPLVVAASVASTRPQNPVLLSSLAVATTGTI